MYSWLTVPPSLALYMHHFNQHIWRRHFLKLRPPNDVTSRQFSLQDLDCVLFGRRQPTEQVYSIEKLKPEGIPGAKGNSRSKTLRPFCKYTVGHMCIIRFRLVREQEYDRLMADSIVGKHKEAQPNSQQFETRPALLHTRYLDVPMSIYFKLT